MTTKPTDEQIIDALSLSRINNLAASKVQRNSEDYRHHCVHSATMAKRLIDAIRNGTQHEPENQLDAIWFEYYLTWANAFVMYYGKKHSELIRIAKEARAIRDQRLHELRNGKAS